MGFPGQGKLQTTTNYNGQYASLANCTVLLCLYVDTSDTRKHSWVEKSTSRHLSGTEFRHEEIPLITKKPDPGSST